MSNWPFCGGEYYFKFSYNSFHFIYVPWTDVYKAGADFFFQNEARLKETIGVGGGDIFGKLKYYSRYKQRQTNRFSIFFFRFFSFDSLNFKGDCNHIGKILRREAPFKMLITTQDLKRLCSVYFTL